MSTHNGSKIQLGELRQQPKSLMMYSENEMPQAVIYSRVSTSEQVEKKQSLDMQENACRDHASKLDIRIAKVFREEGESAKTADRPKLIEMMAYCQANKGRIKYVIVWKVDRFARKTEDHLTMRALLMKFGVQLISATEPIEDTNTGKLMETILAGFAEFDNGLRSERSRNGMLGRVKEGGWVHQAPIGYNNVKDVLGRPTLEPNAMAPKVTTLLMEFKKGLYTQLQAVTIAKQLDIRTKTGNVVSNNGIYRMLRNPVYAGLVTSSMFPEAIKGLHTPLISSDDHDAILAILDGRRRALVPENRSKDAWPLRRFLYCAECESPLTGSYSKGRTKRYGYYHCVKCKAGIRIEQNKAHALFGEAIHHVQASPEILQLFKEIVVRRWNQEHKKVQAKRQKIDTELQAYQTRRQVIVDKHLQGLYSDDLAMEQLDRIAVKKIELELRRDELHAGELKQEAVIDLAIKFIHGMKALWGKADIQNRQRFQKMIFPAGIAVTNDDKFGISKVGACFEEIDLLKHKTEATSNASVTNKSTLVNHAMSNWNTLLSEMTGWWKISMAK